MLPSSPCFVGLHGFNKAIPERKRLGFDAAVANWSVLCSPSLCKALQNVWWKSILLLSLLFILAPNPDLTLVWGPPVFGFDPSPKSHFLSHCHTILT